MQVLITHLADCCRVTLVGRFTSADDKAFVPVLEEISAGRASQFVFDLSKLEFADSFALGLLLVARDEVVKNRATMRLTQPQPNVQRVFALTGLAGLLTVEGLTAPPPTPAKARNPAPPPRSSRFGMSVTAIDGRVSMSLSGRFTFAEVEEFRDAVAASAAKSLVIDLTQLEFMDSAALSAFLIAHDEIGAVGGRMVLANPQNRIRKLFDLTAVGSLLHIEEGGIGAG